MTEPPQERATKYVRYLEEKCILPPDVSDNLRPSALKQQIEQILTEMYTAHKERKVAADD